MRTLAQKNEYVEQKYVKWKEKYDIPDYEEFMLKVMFDLEHQYNNTPDEHIKTKSDILRTINDIKKDCNFKYSKSQKIEDKDKNIILIVTDNDDRYLREIFYNMLGKEVINYTDVRNNSVILTGKYIIKFKEKNSNNLRGMRCDYFLNLTSDKKFENEILIPMVRDN